MCRGRVWRGWVRQSLFQHRPAGGITHLDAGVLRVLHDGEDGVGEWGALFPDDLLEELLKVHLADAVNVDVVEDVLEAAQLLVRDHQGGHHLLGLAVDHDVLPAPEEPLEGAREPAALLALPALGLGLPASLLARGLEVVGKVLDVAPALLELRLLGLGAAAGLLLLVASARVDLLGHFFPPPGRLKGMKAEARRPSRRRI